MGRFEDDLTSALRAGQRFEDPDVGAARAAVAGRVARRARRRTAMTTGGGALALCVLFAASVLSSNVSDGGSGDDAVAVRAPEMAERTSGTLAPVALSEAELPAGVPGAGIPAPLSAAPAGDLGAAKQSGASLDPSSANQEPVQVAAELAPGQEADMSRAGVDLRTDLVVDIDGATVLALSPTSAGVSVPTARGRMTVEVSTSGSFTSKPTGPVVSVVVDGVPVLLTVREVGSDVDPALAPELAAETIDLLAGSMRFGPVTVP